MTSFLSVLNSLDPVPDRLLVGAVMRMSSSSRTRRAAAAWLVSYELARRLGLGMDQAEACAADAYESALCDDGRSPELQDADD